MLPRAATYEVLREGFHWALPERLNMAAQVLAQPSEQVAIIDLSGARREVTYG